MTARNGTRDRFPKDHSPGFTLVELLVVLAVVALIAALLMPALSRGRSSARRVQCLSQLHQLGLAAQLYWDDHNGRLFRYRAGSTNGGDVYWFGWLARGAEGTRAFDPSAGALHPYLSAHGVNLCPALDHALREFKRKATGAAHGYGYNLHASTPPGEPALPLSRVERPSSTLLLADAAQVNTFQPPASPSHPMLEEFYYVNASEPTTHFRHLERANGVFFDGHAAGETMLDGTLDRRLPRHRIARLPPGLLLLDPE